MATGTEIAKAYIQILPSMQGIQSNLSNGLSNPSASAGKSAGKKAGSNFASSFKRFIVSAGIGAAIGKAFTGGAELQQNLGGTEVVFGEFASTIQNYAQTAYKNMGTSASEYMATANKMGSLFQGSGLEQARAMELSTQAMQRAADVASVMGIDTAMALESIAGAAKGNFTMMDNLGVAMNATNLEAYALSKGLDFTWNSATNAEKAELAMQMFFERTEQYAGNFARESVSTISGSLGAMKAAAADLMNNIVLGLDPTAQLQALIETTTVFLTNNAIPALFNLVNGVIAAAPQIFEAAMGLLAGLGQGLVEQLPTLMPAITALIVDLALMLTKPENLMTLVNTSLQLILALADGLIQAVPQLIQAVPVIISNLLAAIASNLPLILGAGVELVLMLIDGIIQSGAALIDAGRSIINTIGSGIREMVSSAVTWGKDLVQNFINGITAKWQALKDKVSALAGTVRDYLGFSEPEKGPLSNFHTYAPDMIDLFTSGIIAGEKQVKNAVFGVARIAADALSGGDMRYSSLAAGHNLSHTAVSPSNDSAILAQTVSALGAKIENMKIYLDGDKLVGGTTARADAALGERQLLVSRGVI